jgi:hypothetical protein
MTRSTGVTTPPSVGASSPPPPWAKASTSAEPLPRVTVETTLDPADAELFFGLYNAAFRPLRTRAVARQVLYRDEFFAQMTDPRVWKFIAWGSDGRAAGLSTLTSDLVTVPWISPEYFASRYPEQTARNAVYYWGFTVTCPDNHRDLLFRAMLTAICNLVADHNGVCGYDMCALNSATLQYAGDVRAISPRLSALSLSVLDTQTYYCATLA